MSDITDILKLQAKMHRCHKMESLAVMMENAAAEIESLRSKIESLFQIIDPIQDERDAIEAQMELMRDALKSVRDYGSASWDDWLIEKADKALAIPEGEATAKLKYVAGEDALEQFANELVQIHNLAMTSMPVEYAKESAGILREKANQSLTATGRMC